MKAISLVRLLAEMLEHCDNPDMQIAVTVDGRLYDLDDDTEENVTVTMPNDSYLLISVGTEIPTRD